jgi:dipeptidyl aminopeptidase/acylaminoacyl peptidase
MSKPFALLTLIIFGVVGQPQDSEEVVQYSIEQFMKTVTVNGGFFNSEETKLLFSSNETGVFNAYVIDIKTGEKTQVTESITNSVTAVGFFPDDERILYTSDRGGSGITHLFLIEKDGSLKELTQGEQTQEQFIRFSDDGKRFFTLCTQRDPKKLDVYCWETETLEKELIFPNDGGYLVTAISPDNSRLALERLNTINDSDIYIKDLASEKEPVHITPHQGERLYYAAGFSRDGEYLYYRTNLNSEFLYVKRYEIASGRDEDYYKADWDVDSISFSKSGRYQVAGINVDSCTRIEITDLSNGGVLELPNLPAGQITAVTFSPSEKLIRFTLAGDTSPTNIFIFDIEANTIKQLTDTLNPEIKPTHLVAGRVVRFKARDGLEIPGILYKPLGATADRKAPVLLWIHDGPRGQNNFDYDPQIQFLVNHGYGIFAINQRGSLGYGKSFFAADDFKYGREPLWDCVDGKKYAQTLDWVNPENIGILGQSMGGYMVLAALAFEPEEFAVGVDLFGVNNLMYTVLNIPDYWENQRQAFYLEVGDPQMDEENLIAISPFFSAAEIRRPLFVVHGANDPFVSQAEVISMIETIRSKGVEVEFMLFEDEGFSFSKSENIAEAYNAILKFLDRHMKGVS